MAVFVCVNGPRTSREEPDRQESQVQRRERSKRLIKPDMNSFWFHFDV